MVLAEHRDMRYDIHGRDVGRENNHAGRLSPGRRRRAGFAEAFDDFLDPAFERLVLGR